MFASKNKVLPSILDAIGMGIGFTAALLAMGSIREILGSGTWFGLPITQGVIDPMIIMILPPGGFFVFGILVAIANKLAGDGKKAKLGCAGCPMAENCATASGLNDSNEQVVCEINSEDNKPLVTASNKKSDDKGGDK